MNRGGRRGVAELETPHLVTFGAVVIRASDDTQSRVHRLLQHCGAPARRRRSFTEGWSAQPLGLPLRRFRRAGRPAFARRPWRCRERRGSRAARSRRRPAWPSASRPGKHAARGPQCGHRRRGDPVPPTSPLKPMKLLSDAMLLPHRQLQLRRPGRVVQAEGAVLAPVGLPCLVLLPDQMLGDVLLFSSRRIWAQSGARRSSPRRPRRTATSSTPHHSRVQPAGDSSTPRLGCATRRPVPSMARCSSCSRSPALTACARSSASGTPSTSAWTAFCRHVTFLPEGAPRPPVQPRQPVRLAPSGDRLPWNGRSASRGMSDRVAVAWVNRDRVKHASTFDDITTASTSPPLRRPRASQPTAPPLQRTGAEPLERRSPQPTSLPLSHSNYPHLSFLHLHCEPLRRSSEGTVLDERVHSIKWRKRRTGSAEWSVGCPVEA